MNWQKEFGYDYQKNTDFLMLTIIILAIFSMIVNRPILFLIIGFFGAYLVINYFYDKYIGEHLSIVNGRQTIRLFPGDETSLTIHFKNQSIIPYVNGRFEFQLDDNVTSPVQRKEKDQQIPTYEIPLSIIGRGQTTLNLPLTAQKRGVARVRNIQYHLPHLFNFDQLLLKYYRYFSLEFVVFPKLKPVEQAEKLFEWLPGDDLTNFSPYEDIQSPLGTRAYSYSDPFHRINWKATAKTQQLQTNVYEKTIEKSYFFIVNLSAKDSPGIRKMTRDLENILSYTAFLTQEATKEKVAYQVAINTRRFGNKSYVHLPNGQGQAHYMNTLEMLARIHPQSMSISFTDMIYRLRQQIHAANIIVFIGHVPAEAVDLLYRLNPKNKRMYHVKSEHGSLASMKPLAKEVKNDDSETIHHYV